MSTSSSRPALQLVNDFTNGSPCERVIFVLKMAGLDESAATELSLLKAGATEAFCRALDRRRTMTANQRRQVRVELERLRQTCRQELLAYLVEPNPGWNVGRVIQMIETVMRAKNTPDEILAAIHVQSNQPSTHDDPEPDQVPAA